MKVKIANLGVIKEAEIDLKPLTVFIGRNGTGKTWTAYTLASILGQNGFEIYCQNYIDKKTQHRYPIIDNAIEQFLQEGTVSVDLIDFAEKYIEVYINDVATLAHSWMNKFLGTNRVNFKNLEIIFDVAKVKRVILENIKLHWIQGQQSFGTPSKNILHILKEEGERKIYFYLVSTSEDSILSKLPRKVFEQILIQEIFEIIHRVFYSYTYIFPTERTGVLPFFSSSVKIEEYEDYEDIDDEEENISSKKLSTVVKDLKLTLENVYIKTLSEREEEIKNQPEVAEYLKLAEILETEILEGKIKIVDSLFDQEIIYEPAENVNLEMAVASSMVKELAPLVLCLRYLAMPNELLIIDEPEMNLHPAAQVAIAEFLAMLVQAGLNVLITTHSPYIVDHLSNLIRASKREDKEEIKTRFYFQNTDAFISQEKVSVYLFEDNTAKNILNEDGCIDWGTFADISSHIANILL